MHTYLDIIGHNLSMEFDNVSCGRGMKNEESGISNVTFYNQIED